MFALLHPCTFSQRSIIVWRCLAPCQLAQDICFVSQYSPLQCKSHPADAFHSLAQFKPKDRRERRRASSSPRPIRLHNLRNKPLKNCQRANPLLFDLPRSHSLPPRPLTGYQYRYARPLCEDFVDPLLFRALFRVSLIVAAGGVETWVDG